MVKEQNSKNKIPKTNKGITLIALIITIIVMLILVAVTINMAINGGLFNYAKKAVSDTQTAIDAEQQLANGAIQVDGVWYDSIDDYIAGKPSENDPDSPVKITLSIAGEKVTTVPLPSSDFEHIEGTIDTGYVIRHKTDGNEFVWVPVDKNQKITLKVTSEKDVTDLKLFDPCGDVILTVENGNVQTTYNNTDITPTFNGMYIAQVTTEDGVTEKTLVVKSLYAKDSGNDVFLGEEYEAYIRTTVAGTELEGASREELFAAFLEFESVEAMNTAIADAGCNSINQFLTLMLGQEVKAYEDLANYSESVNNNGGFYIGRYEAGAPTLRTSGSSTATVSEILDANGTPVSKANAYPYNYITHSQAQGLAESMYNSDEFTDTLLTHSAWDRTVDWIYETKGKTMEQLFMNSGSWGNYIDVTFDITKGKYSTNYGSSYTDVSGTYTKPENTSILLTTGATTRNFTNNIFDLAGNVWEWTLASYTSTGGSLSFPVRGGGCNHSGGGVRSRYDNDESNCYYGNGFRPALYLN